MGNCFRIQGAQPGALEQPRGVGWGAGWKEVSRGRDICILMAALGFPGGSAGQESACNAGDPGSISSLGRSPGGGHGKPLQYSCLENPHGQRSLAGYSPWGSKELETTGRLRTAQHGCFPFVQQNPTQQCKAIIPQFKKKMKINK